jgi:putative ABC transport system permease protein
MSAAKDLRYAARGLAREPGFTAVALLTLGLVIGANTAIFSIASGLLLRPLPLPQPDRLVGVFRHFPQGEPNDVSVPIFFFLRDRMRAELADAAAYEAIGSGYNLVGDGLPERLRGSRVTASFLPTMDVRPLLGRNFLPEEDRPGAPPVVILSHRLWARRFAADPHILGRQLRLNGESYTVVGVMPPAFRFPSFAELWTPFGLDPASTEIASYFELLGRLRPEVTLTAADAKARALAGAFRSAFPNHMAPTGTFVVHSLQDRLYGRARAALVVLMVAVGAVTLIACVNLANLQLARAAARQREITIRAVLGAGTGRIVRQLLTESLLLATLGGAVGLLLGAAIVGPLLRLSPMRLDPLVEVGIDGRVLAFTAAVSLAAGLLFGLVPALQGARGNLAEPLKEGSNRAAGSVGRQWLRRGLVVSEVALALVLITCATLVVRSFSRAMETAAGFTTEHVLTMKLSLPILRYGEAGAFGRFGDQVVERLEALPGVRAAAFTTSMPLEAGPALDFQVVGRQPTGGEDGQGNYNASYRAVSADLFKVLGVGLVRGRGFTTADRLGTPLVALVNEAAARRVFPHQDPVGQRIMIGSSQSEVRDRGARTIVGVVRDTHEDGLDREVPAMIFVPMGQMPDPFLRLLLRVLPQSLAVRMAAGSPALTAQMKKAIWSVDPGQPIADVRTMGEIRDESLGARRFLSTLLSCMALLALALAAVGIYGVLSYLVHQRTREIGVRLALGASTPQVLRLILGQGLGAVLAGIVLGLGGAFAAARLISTLLYGVTARDPATFLFTPAFLGAVALLAAAIPAYRASHLDPLEALREE